MAKNLIPIAFTLIDEGQLAEDLDAELHDAISHLLKHRAKYGEESTEKTKAEITLKLTITAGTKEAYTIKGALSRKVPGRPTRGTFAIGGYDEGKPTLFVPPSGSDADDPRQGRLVPDLPAAAPRKGGE